MATGSSIPPTATFSPPSSTTSSPMVMDSCGGNITNISMVSAAERDRYLESLQDDTTDIMIPAMTWLVLLGVTGLVGNSLVLFIYSQKFAQTATKILILTIASFDLLANVVVIPTNIYDMFYMWNFNNPHLCRLRKFTNSFTTLSSAMVLVAVAVVRYRKVCTPYGWQVKAKHAKFISIGVAVFGIIFSLPYAIINGRETRKTPRPSICGYACDIDDQYSKTSWPLVVNGFFLLLCIAFWTPLIVMYVKIGMTAWKHKKQYGASGVSMAAKMKTKSGLNSETRRSRRPSSPEVSSNTNGNSKMTESFECSSETVDLNLEDSTFSERPDMNGVSKLKQVTEDKSEVAVRANNKRAEYTFNHGKDDDNLERHRVRIVNDRVEITTPMMSHFVEQIKKATKDGADEVGFGRSASNGASSSKTVVGPEDNQSSKGLTGFEGFKRNGPDADALSGLDSKEHANTTDKASNGTPPVASKRRKKANGISCDDPLDESTKPISYRSTVADEMQDADRTVSADKDDPDDTNRASVFTGIDEPQTSDRSIITGATANNYSLTQKLSDHKSNGDNDIIGRLTALKWLHITYVPNKDVCSKDNDCGEADEIENDEADASFSVRLSPSNNVLEKVEILRELVIEALEKEKAGTGSEANEMHGFGGATFLEQQENSLCEPHHECTPPNDTVVAPRERNKGSEDDEIVNIQSGTLKKLKSLVAKANPGKRLSKRREGHHRPLGRTTIMLFIISAVFLVGFVPYLAVIFFTFAAPKKFEALTMVELSFYHLFLRFYLLNSAANPIVYSLCNINFRRKCIALFKRCSRRN